MKHLPLGSIIGILGGGQLGRMAAIEAASLGYRTHVYSPGQTDPAKAVSTEQTTAPYDDMKAVQAFSKNIDVATFEFENIPDHTVTMINNFVQVRPSVNILKISQHRGVEKKTLNDLGIKTAPWIEINSPDDMEHAKSKFRTSAILKTSRFGYDGKGHIKINDPNAILDAWNALGGVSTIMEETVDFEREISVLVARDLDENIASYVPVDNVHRDHILYTTTAPSTVKSSVANEAVSIAKKLALKLNLHGLLAVEMFVTRGSQLLVNEIAPRPHNSGHWTLDACAVNQFEQFIRAVVGLPIGNPVRHSNAVMTNLIGSEINSWTKIISEHNACLHIYGKTKSRKGRKMGHVTRLFSTTTAP